MKEYHIASIIYNKKNDWDLDKYHETINHIFISSENPDFDNEDLDHMEEIDEPAFIPSSLCDYRPYGLLVNDGNDFNDISKNISWDDFKKVFFKNSKKRFCKVCTNKFKKLFPKEVLNA